MEEEKEADIQEDKDHQNNCEADDHDHEATREITSDDQGTARKSTD